MLQFYKDDKVVILVTIMAVSTLRLPISHRHRSDSRSVKTNIASHLHRAHQLPLHPALTRPSTPSVHPSSLRPSPSSGRKERGSGVRGELVPEGSGWMDREKGPDTELSRIVS